MNTRFLLRFSLTWAVGAAAAAAVLLFIVLVRGAFSGQLARNPVPAAILAGFVTLLASYSALAGWVWRKSAKRRVQAGSSVGDQQRSTLHDGSVTRLPLRKGARKREA